MEQVDIFDRQGRPTGVVRKRGEPLGQGEYLMAVGIWIVDEENNILLTQRSPEKRWAPGKWENTAGHVQAGEDCVTAILREVQEETGLVLSREQLIYLGGARSGHYLGKKLWGASKKAPGKIEIPKGRDLWC